MDKSKEVASLEKKLKMAKDKAKKVKVEEKKAKAKEISDELLDNCIFVTEDQRFIPRNFAKWVDEMSDYHFVNIRETDELFYYDNGIYIPHGDKYVGEMVQREVGWDANVTTANVKEVLGYIKRLNTYGIDCMSSVQNMLVCGNGVLDLITLELHPHSHENFAFKGITWNYNPEAKCPIFDELINKLLPDTDAEYVIHTMIGYTLINSYLYNQIFFLHGLPGTGKTTVVNIIRHLLNVENTSNILLHDLLYRPFMRVGLIGCFANFSPDASNEKIEDASVLKGLSGDGYMDIDKKNVPNPIKLQNTAKLIIDTNDMPAFNFRDDALHRRLIRVNFRYVVPEEDKSAGYMKSLLTQDEMEGILARGVTEAHRILTTENPFDRMPIEKSKEDYEANTYGIVDEFIYRHIQIIRDHPEDDIFETQPDIWLQFRAFAEKQDIKVTEIPKVVKFNNLFRLKCGLDMPKNKSKNGVTKKVYYDVSLTNVDTRLKGFTK